MILLKHLVVTLLLFICLSCNSIKKINIYIENSSMVKDEVTVETYLDGQLCDSRVVKRGESTIHWEHVTLDLPIGKDSFSVAFKIPRTQYYTTCQINKKDLTKETWVHVNLSEVLFKKGYTYYTGILERDTIVSRGFFCEILPHK